MAGSGTELDPYIITTPAELDSISADLTAYYKLGNDIDYGGFIWVPIGDWGTGETFQGGLDGDYHTISNMVIFDNGIQRIGMFGGMENATIKNLIIDNVSVSIGSILNQSVAIIAGISMSSTFTDVKVSNCSVSAIGEGGGDVSGDAGIFTGGGSNSFERCASVDNTITIETNLFAYAGGIAKSGNFIDCYSRVIINITNPYPLNGAGGIANYSEVTRCYSASDVNADGDDVGGFWGSGGVATDNNYWDNLLTVNGGAGVGEATVYGKPTFQMQSQATFEGWDFDTIWAIDPAINDGYPYLQWEYPSAPPLELLVETLPCHYVLLNSAMPMGRITNGKGYHGFEYWRDSNWKTQVWGGSARELLDTSITGLPYTYGKDLSGLLPGTTYSYRAMFEDYVTEEFTYGEVMQFTTAPSPIFGEGLGKNYKTVRDVCGGVSKLALARLLIDDEGTVKYESREHRKI